MAYVWEDRGGYGGSILLPKRGNMTLKIPDGHGGWIDAEPAPEPAPKPDPIRELRGKTVSGITSLVPGAEEFTIYTEDGCSFTFDSLGSIKDISGSPDVLLGNQLIDIEEALGDSRNEYVEFDLFTFTTKAGVLTVRWMNDYSDYGPDDFDEWEPGKESFVDCKMDKVVPK